MTDQTEASSQNGAVIVRAATGAGFTLSQGDEIDILNTSGTQVVDFWCIARGERIEYLSMEQCREVLAKIYYDPGDVLLSNHYTPMVLYVADTSAGGHDTLIPACNIHMYRRFGRDDEHPSCEANLQSALRAMGIAIPYSPQPWNLFMSARVREDGAIQFSRPPLQPGASVTLRLLVDAAVIVSACPDDCYPTNGGDGSPADFSVVLRKRSNGHGTLDN